MITTESVPVATACEIGPSASTGSPVVPIVSAPASLPAAPLPEIGGPTKIRPQHRLRLAVVYVRQSTPNQVIQHRESTALQYALQRRALEWGWPRERVLVIDQDQGRSAPGPAGSNRGGSLMGRCGEIRRRGGFGPAGSNRECLCAIPLRGIGGRAA